MVIILSIAISCPSVSTLPTQAKYVGFHMEESLWNASHVFLYQVGECQYTSINKAEKKLNTGIYLWLGFKSNKPTAPERMVKKRDD